MLYPIKKGNIIMINKKSTLTILFLTLTSLSFADSTTEDEIKKALEGITQIKVLDEQEPKVVSEVIVEEKKIITPKKSYEKSHEKSHEKTYKKSQKKRSYTKKSKKTYLKRAKEVEDVDINSLPMAETLGVVSKSEPFTLGD